MRNFAVFHQVVPLRLTKLAKLPFVSNYMKRASNSILRAPFGKLCAIKISHCAECSAPVN